MSGSRGEERLRALMRNVSDTIAVFDANGTVVWLGGNPGGTLGRADDDWLGENGFAHIHPDDREMMAAKLAELVGEPGTEVSADYRVRGADDTWVYCEGVAVNLLHDPLVEGIVLTSRNITARKHTEHLLRQQARILEGIASGAPLDTTLERIVDLVQEAIPGSFCTIAPELPIAAHVDDPWCRVVVGVDDNVRFGLLAVAIDDTRRPTDAESHVIDTAGSLATIAVERTRTEERIRHMALHDPLTNLPNRTLLMDHLTTAIRRTSRHRTPACVMFLDLDGFKKLNDSLGHYAGDEILREVATRLEGAVRPGDTVARLAGDEFVILCEQIFDEAHALTIAARVEAAFATPLHIHGTEIMVSLSIGWAMTRSVEDNPNRVLHEADTAMYRVKSERRARAALFGSTT